MALSKRALPYAEPYPHWDVFRDAWDPTDNPSGWVNLRLAENMLMHDVLNEHLHRNIAVANSGFTYGDGNQRLRAVVAKFLNKYLHPTLPVQADHITVANGCSSALEHLSWALGDPGDVFILGRPHYMTFVPDFTLRMGTGLVTVPFKEVDPLGSDAIECYRAAIDAALSEGKKVAGLILCNPHNPLGRCYSKEVIISLMKLCQQYGIHLVSDEIYALSVFENQVDGQQLYLPFTSCLSIDTTGIIDPSLLHVIWGTSKDFGANGLRMGALISQHNTRLHDALLPATLYGSTSLISEHIVINMLEDEKWVEDYVAENQRRLSDSHALAARWAKKHNIDYAKGVNAAFFLWLDFGAVLPKDSVALGETKTDVIMRLLLAQKVYLLSGVDFGAEKDGWIRIVFTIRRDVLEESLRRIETALSLR